MATNIVTIEDLQIFKNELIKELTSIYNNKAQGPKFLKSADVRKMLGLSAGTLQTLRINGSLPYTKLNGTLYYSYDEVIEALNKNKSNKDK
ncbi:MAG: transcriptional regulator [Bacteroidetes bacterium RIFCSPLOWO2_12_FULL_35_15]|nr:MAG: transcriptional regulator [Bacteroidetes bacterium RIFCSPLOWO2_12_FULL_35_15]